MLLAAPQTNLWWTTKWYVSGPKMSSSIFHAREQSLMIAVENDSPSRRIERGVPSRWWSWENQEEAWNGQIDRKRKSRIIGWSWYEIFDWFLIYLSRILQRNRSFRCSQMLWFWNGKEESMWSCENFCDSPVIFRFMEMVLLLVMERSMAVLFTFSVKILQFMEDLCPKPMLAKSARSFSPIFWFFWLNHW